jgi:hypothetical protein
LSRLVVRRYEPSDAGAWDAFAATSRSAHFFFQRGYMDYHADRFEDCSLLVHDEGRLVAALPATRSEDVVVSHGGLTFGGLIGDATLTQRRTVAVLEAVRDHLAGEGVAELRYKPVPHIYHRSPNEEDLYALFTLGAELAGRAVSCAVRPDEPETWSKGRRSAVRQAERSGLEIGPSTDYDEFMRLQAQTLERHGVEPVHTAAELTLLASRFPANISLWAARRDGQLLAGVVVYETEVVAHAQYIASGPEGRDAAASDAVIAFLLGERLAGKRYFDFGISTDHRGGAFNAGLMRYKESFGARAVMYDSYALRTA